MEHYVRPDGSPPANEYIQADKPPASSLVRVSGLVNPEFRIEVEALAAIGASDG